MVANVVVVGRHAAGEVAKSFTFDLQAVDRGGKREGERRERD